MMPTVRNRVLSETKCGFKQVTWLFKVSDFFRHMGKVIVYSTAVTLASIPRADVMTNPLSLTETVTPRILINVICSRGQLWTSVRGSEHCRPPSQADTSKCLLSAYYVRLHSSSERLQRHSIWEWGWRQ